MRYEHTADEREPLLAQELNRYAEATKVVPLDDTLQPDGALSAHESPKAKGEVIAYPH